MRIVEFERLAKKGDIFVIESFLACEVVAGVNGVAPSLFIKMRAFQLRKRYLVQLGAACDLSSEPAPAAS